MCALKSVAQRLICTYIFGISNKALIFHSEVQVLKHGHLNLVTCSTNREALHC